MKSYIVALTLLVMSTGAIASGGLSIENSVNVDYQGASVSINPQSLAQGDIKSFDVQVKDNQASTDNEALKHG